MSVTAPSNNEPLIQNDEKMRYRPLGKTGLMVSALSFGCMRLFEDMELNEKMLSKAIDYGINYFETTRGYCSGQCQQRTAPGIKGKTSGVIVSGKAAISPDTTAYGFRKEIELQLEILGLSHFKFFQVGWFGWDRIGHLLKRGGVLDAIREAQDQGLIQRIGFTGHDTPDNFIKCIETGLFDSLTVPYNLINRSYEPAISRAGELGVGVVAMCPVAGGMLASESSRIQTELGINMPTIQMALEFVLSNPNVSTVCSGMNTIEMLDQNVQIVKDFDPAGDFNAKVCEGLDRMREAFGDKFCTSCRYCMPCPEGLNIPYLMGLHQNWRVFGIEDSVKLVLKRTEPGGETIPKWRDPSACVKCGKCETACPNQLGIIKAMEELSELMKQG